MRPMLFIALLTMGAVVTEAAPGPVEAQVRAPSSLAGVQDRILGATRQAFATRDFGGFDRVEAEIAGVAASGAQASHYKSYWLGFLNYQRSLALQRVNRREEARTALERSITTLKAMPTKDVEVNALLGLATGLNLQFVPRPQIVLAAQDSGSYVKASLAGGRPSARAYYASAIADWNTPMMYGGMLKAEDLAKKAIAASEPASSIRPTWGRDEATALLIRIYHTRKRGAEAKALLQSAQRQFPQSLAIAEVAGQI